MYKNRLPYSALLAATFILGACGPASATPQPFEKSVIIGEGWEATRAGEDIYVISDERGGDIDGSKRQEFLTGVLKTMQDEHGCVIISEKPETDDSKRVIFKNPDCLET